jgi:ATP synthase subunit 6
MLYGCFYLSQYIGGALNQLKLINNIMNKILITSPLEQFRILPIAPMKWGFIDISLTNQTVILVLLFFFTIWLICFLAEDDTKVLVVNNAGSYYLIPTWWQTIIEKIHKLVLSLVKDNIKDETAPYFFPLVFFTFMFILLSNVIGLIPYSFTLTSQLIVTLAFSLAIFIGINIVCFRIHGIKFFALFLPPGTSIALAFLLVPIELISYIFKPVSLSIRLFANMMAGHTLLKVIGGFAFTLMSCTGILFLVHYFPLFILVPLFALELGVALIQSFVFSILICIYLNDSINLH